MYTNHIKQEDIRTTTSVLVSRGATDLAAMLVHMVSLAYGLHLASLIHLLVEGQS